MLDDAASNQDGDLDALQRRLKFDLALAPNDKRVNMEIT
jgi:hypothetical protein